MTAEQSLLEFAAGLPRWVQDGLRRSSQTGEITAEDEAELYRMALSAHGLIGTIGTVPLPVALAATHLSTALTTTDSYLVTGLKDIQHVNTLASGQSLTFAPQGMTVIFGYNGSGKSGYSRLFKSACRSADNEPIHRNIFSQGQGVQSAVFTVAGTSDPSNVTSAPWTPTAKPDQLATLAFYDVRCARALIDKDNEIAYSPTLLRGVDALGTAVGKIVSKLGQEADTAERLPEALMGLTVNVESPVAIAFRKLKPASPGLSEFEALRGLNEAQRQMLSQAIVERHKLDAEDPTKAAALEDRNGSAHQSRLDQVAQLASALSTERLTSIALLISDKFTTAAATKQILEVSLGACPLLGVGSNPWRNLYNAARAYSIERAYLEQEFPVTGDGSHCVLCQQPLAEDGKNRFRAFDQVMRAEAEKLAKSSAQRLSTEAENIKRLPHCSQFDPWMEKLAELDAASAELVRQWLNEADEKLRTVILAATDAETSLPESIPDFPCQQMVEAVISGHRERANLARGRIDPAGLAKQRAGFDKIIHDFASRRLLDEQWATLETYASSLGRSKRLREASESITTTKVRRFQTKLAELMLTKRIADDVNAELTGLGYTGFRPVIKTSSSGGPARQSLVFVDRNEDPIRGVRLPEVFSEGEQKVISLALFLTEVRAAPGKPGIILDDPVCSMDEEWKGKIAIRLVKEAGERQVIIFTHSVAFLQALTDSCAKMGCPVRTHAVQRIGMVAGHITTEQVWGAMNLSARISWLRNEVQVATALHRRDPTSTDYLARLNLIADRVRATWERVVEEGMFSEAVVRYRKGVETKRIENKGLATSAVLFARVHWGMTEMSAITEAHDTAAEIGSPLFGPEDMQRWLVDLEGVVALIDQERRVSKSAIDAAIRARPG